MTCYNDSPDHQKIEGTACEWEAFHLFQEIGSFFGSHLQDGKNTAALINWDGRNTISPDILVLRGADRYFLEIKSKLPTSYGTLGFPISTIDQYIELTEESQIDILLVVRDKTLAPVGKKDPSAFKVASLCPELFKDAVKFNGHWYFQPHHFQSLVEFLEEDREDFDSYNAHMVEYRQVDGNPQSLRFSALSMLTK